MRSAGAASRTRHRDGAEPRFISESAGRRKNRYWQSPRVDLTSNISMGFIGVLAGVPVALRLISKVIGSARFSTVLQVIALTDCASGRHGPE
jgi:hypothetical protein